MLCRESGRLRQKHDRLLLLELRETVDLTANYSDRSLVAAALPHLKTALKEVLVMHYWWGMKLPEIAKKLQVPLSTVRGRLQHARAALKATLDSSGIDG